MMHTIECSPGELLAGATFMHYADKKTLCIHAALKGLSKRVKMGTLTAK